ncbi:MAG: hypothetical protein MMC33_005371 [Icmadophila ericetorum]|nr:hypothetical protein [Icmadophila ericetorum]
MEFLKSAVASAISKGPPFPYTFGEKIDLEQSIWTLYNGTKREDGSPCSIFTYEITPNKSRLPLAKNAVRKLRTLRHPGIIRVLDTVEASQDDVTETYIYVATERVTPLGWHVRRKSLSVETTKWGLYTIANTLKFINDEALSVHGNIRASSIFTSDSGEWRLGGLDVLSSIKEDDSVIYTYGSSVPDSARYHPPEVTRSGWETIKKNPVSAPDSYAYGLLIYEVFNGGALSSDQVGQTKNIPPNIHQSYKRILNNNPKVRLTVASFIEQGRRSGGFFETPLIRLSDGVENLGLKSDEERGELLSELDELSEDFPEDFFKMKILPELLKSVEFGGGGPKVFAFIMKLGSKLSEDEYDSRITPVIVRLFASPDRQMRVTLLDHLPSMIDHLSQKIVTDKIFPQMITGFTDMAPVVREQTVKAVLTIITKLADRTVNGELLKYLAKTANDEQPGIRTNTMICLGKIARNLGPNTRQKVLIAAFTRGLKDPFVHARNAALQALAATLDLFPEEECANKILPGLCSSLVDKEKVVRDQANKTIDLYLGRVRKYGSTLPDTAMPPPNVPTSNGVVPRIGTPQNDTSWAGWAISSFTNKIASTSGEIEAKTNGSINLGAPITSLNRSSSVPPTTTSSAGNVRSTMTATKSSVRLTLEKQALRTSSTPASVASSTDQFFSDAAQDGSNENDFGDAWGEMGDMHEAETFFDAPDDTVSATASTPNLVSAPASPQKQKSVAAYDDSEPDFAGWLSAQAQSKSKAPLPKGLSKSSTSATSSLGRMVTTGAVGSGLGAKKVAANPKRRVVVPVSKPKTIDTKPKESAGDDWDAWD